MSRHWEWQNCSGHSFRRFESRGFDYKRSGQKWKTVDNERNEKLDLYLWRNLTFSVTREICLAKMRKQYFWKALLQLTVQSAKDDSKSIFCFHLESVRWLCSIQSVRWFRWPSLSSLSFIGVEVMSHIRLSIGFDDWHQAESNHLQLSQIKWYNRTRCVTL